MHQSLYAKNFYKIHLDLISIAFQYDISIEVLHELWKTIQKVQDQTLEITKDLAQDNADFIWQDVNSTIEELHGAAFGSIPEMTAIQSLAVSKTNLFAGTSKGVWRRELPR